MKTVYRVESPDTHTGPYNYYNEGDLGDAAEWFRNHSPMFDDGHLAWQEDGMSRACRGYDEDAWYAACDSLDSLREWFDTHLTYLAEAGWQVVSYDVADKNVMNSRSGKQVAFLRNDRTRASRRVLTAEEVSQ